MSGDHWSLRWSYFATTLRRFYLSYVTTGINREAIYYVDKINTVSSFVLCGVSVLTSNAISGERLLALLSGLRYRHVTLRRVRAVIFCFWMMVLSCGLIYVWNIRISFTIFCAFVMISVVNSLFSYAKMYAKLRQYHLQVQVFPRGEPNGIQVPLNIARFKKSVSSVLLVQLVLVTCYIPLLIVVILMTYGRMSGENLQVAYLITATLTYLNSSVNPVLYCWGWDQCDKQPRTRSNNWIAVDQIWSWTIVDPEKKGFLKYDSDQYR